MSKKKTPRNDETKRVEVELACAMTDEEKSAAGGEIASLVVRRAVIDEERKAVTKTFTDKIKELDKKIGKLAKEVHEGSAMRMVRCTEHHVFATNTVITIRDDTGAEVGKRAMKVDERQEAIAFPAPGGGAAEAADFVDDETKH